MKIKLKPLITVAACILVYVSAGVITGISLGSTSANLEETAHRETAMLLDSYKKQVNDTLDSYRYQIQVGAHNDAVSDSSLSVDDRKAALAQMAKSSDLLDYSVSDANGITLSDTDISEREYFKEAMKGNTYISSPVIRKTDNSVVIMGAAALPDGAGAIYSGISYETFSDRITSSMYEDSFSLIIDKTGQLVAYDDAAAVAKILTLSDLSKEDAKEFADIAALQADMISGKSGETTITRNDVVYKVSYAPLDNIEGWSIAAAISEEELMGTYDVLLQNIIIALVILGFFGLAMGLFLAKILGGPAALVSARLSLLVKGDLKTPFARRHSITGDYQLLFDSMTDTIDLLQNYVADIDHVLHGFANKDLTVTTSVKYIGDFEPIYTSMHEIKTNLHDIMDTLTNVSNEIHQGAAQLQSAADLLANTATEQSQSAGSLNIGINEISGSLKSTSDEARSATDIVSTAVSMASEGKEKMTMMLASMEDITHASEEIGKIIKTIDDIAFQTNILALNAAVEAARAGEAGKGFSVVAEEVRNLASKSAEAAKDTTGLIGNSIDSVKKGTDIADDTADALQKIVTSIEQVNTLIAAISADTAAQTSELTALVTNTDHLTESANENSATSEECAATTRQFMEQVENLRSIMNGFKM
ncbi:MAG: methyl-accepting chemotaxis protein [Ruminococcus sp.]|jgi:methyl-accepting chemotaxis protein|nr:methyl-accepting chemotaxis protein [Ruminococcus sp.]